MILPRPGSKSDYVLFHQTFELDANSYAFSPQLLLSTIDMTLSAGTGQVVQKNISVINDSLRLGGLTAVKHANGRDWWILTKQFSKELYYKILLTPNGIASIDTQSVAGAFAIFDGQAKFSPDGNWYATYSNLQGLRLYNFDRCTGTLFNFTYISPNDSIFVGGGLAFGSESKTLFINNTFRLIQYDLQAPNIALSEKIIADAEVFHSPFPPWISQFSYTSNGIDNKIYICTFDNTSSLHVIHNPNGIGKQCGFHPHSQYIGGLHMEGLPVFSGFQLGPVVGSSCDTLPDNNQNRIDINKVFQCTTLNLLPPNSHTSQTIKDQIQVRNFRKLKDEEVNFRDKLQFHKMLLKNDFNPGQQY